jgi:O-antigen ligase
MRTRASLAVFLLVAFMLVIAPFFHSGKPPSAQLILNLCGALLLFIIAWAGLYRQQVERRLWIFLALSILAVAIYLVPVPWDFWKVLPGRDLYVEVYRWLMEYQQIEPDLRLTIIPYQSINALLALIPPLAVFLGTLALSRERIRQLVVLLLGIASLQAAIGIMQALSILPVELFGIPFHEGRGIGTYLNTNHFSGLLEMALPLAFAMLSGVFLYLRTEDPGELRMRLMRLMLLWGGILFLLVTAILFSRSRAGILLAIIAILVSAAAFYRFQRRGRSAKTVMAVASLATAVAISIASIPVLNRFVNLNPMDDDRWTTFENTVEAIKVFFPVGSGPGTFPDIYRAFQPVDQMLFINHAHNDYLELLLEMGLLGGMIIIAFLFLYVTGWTTLYRQRTDQMHLFQVASGISLFILLLHSLVDFNLHTPANAIVFAFLGGIFFRKRQHRGRHQ